MKYIITEEVFGGEFTNLEDSALNEAKATALSKDARSIERASARLKKLGEKVKAANGGKAPSFTVKEIKGGKKAVEGMKETLKRFITPWIIPATDFLSDALKGKVGRVQATKALTSGSVLSFLDPVMLPSNYFLVEFNVEGKKSVIVRSDSKETVTKVIKSIL